jgi:hypothetical protein
MYRPGDRPTDCRQARFSGRQAIEVLGHQLRFEQTNEVTGHDLRVGFGA